MKIKVLVLASALLVSGSASAIQDEADRGNPEEIVIKGERLLIKRMWDAEANAYDIFNKFNDEKRFKISCSIHKVTNSQFVNQTCSPEFVLRASKEHALDYLETLRPPIDGAGKPLPGTVENKFSPMEAEIGRQRPAYKDKMKQIAEQHPEFVEAIKEYARLKAEYEGVEKKEDP